MTAKVTTIYETLLTKLATLYPTKTVIPNAYSLTDNPDIFLKTGYGVRVGPESRSAFQVTREDNSAREFTIFLTSQVFRLENEATNLINASKTLLDEVQALKLALLSFDQWGIEATIYKVDFSGASGIEFFKSDKSSFIYASVSFTIDYAEELI